MSQHRMLLSRIGLSVLLCGGCDTASESRKVPAGAETSRPSWSEQAREVKPQRVVDLPPPTVKEVAALAPVKLSATDEATCRVCVGDVFPDSASVPRGKAAVVAFCPSDDRPIDKLIAEEILASIPAILTKAGATDSVVFIPLDVTQESTLFDAVAQDTKPPRLFLLDAAGKILWFDIEFSVATSGALEQSARFVAQGLAE